MHWMIRWAGRLPGLRGRGRRAPASRDVDGHEYVDFCLGDTGGDDRPRAGADGRGASREQAAAGITLMLPTEDAIWVGAELARRFGLPRWQFALTATDANRFAIRLARELTGRPKILVLNWCYHGSVDETFATLDDGAVVARDGQPRPAGARSPRRRGSSSSTTSKRSSARSRTATSRAC